MTQTDEEIKKEFLKFIDDNDIEVEMKSAVFGFLRDKFHTLQEEYKKELIEKIDKECKFEYFLRSSSGNIVRSVISKKDEMRNEIADSIINIIKQS